MKKTNNDFRLREYSRPETVALGTEFQGDILQGSPSGTGSSTTELEPGDWEGSNLWN